MYRMAYQPIVRELFRSMEAMIHERFTMIEDILRIESEKAGAPVDMP